MPSRSGDEHEQSRPIPLAASSFIRLRVVIVSDLGSAR
jgi:hypothetical protein